MSSTQVATAPMTHPSAPTGDLKLEVIAIPVSDIDRAKAFYLGLGWAVDADFMVGKDFRAVQLTPPGSPCSIHLNPKGCRALPRECSSSSLTSKRPARR